MSAAWVGAWAAFGARANVGVGCARRWRLPQVMREKSSVGLVMGDVKDNLHMLKPHKPTR